MVQYAVDEKAKDMIRLAVGLCKYSENVDGFFEQSIYWSAISFEHIIHSTAKSYGVSTWGKELCEIIEDMCSSPRVKHSEREDQRRHLTELKAIRNRMFHSENFPITYEHAIEMVKAVCKMAQPECAFDKVWREITYEQVRKLRDKVLKICRSPFSVETLDERDICESDFDDLEVLYEKCKFLHFKRLRNLLSPLHLEPEEMSELIPTSGTIWLPWVWGRTPRNRSHVGTIVLGANFTPNFVRVGIDFGSEAYRAKEMYYALLLRGLLDSQLAKLADGYYLIDTFWFFNVRNLRRITDYWPSKADEIKPEIQRALEETREKYRARAPMKGHRLLIGKIFRRESPEFCDFLANVPQTVKDIFLEMLDIVKQVEHSSKILSVNVV